MEPRKLKNHRPVKRLLLCCTVTHNLPRRIHSTLAVTLLIINEVHAVRTVSEIIAECYIVAKVLDA